MGEGYANKKYSKDFVTLLGILAGFFLLFYAIFQGGGLGSFIDGNAFMITFGGTLAATFISFPIHQVIKVFSVFLKIFSSRVRTPEEIIEAIVKLSITAKKGGNLSLGKVEDNIGDEFLKRGVSMVVDGLEADLIESTLDAEIDSLQNRHVAGQQIFNAMANFAPAFGLIGTIIGLVQMLSTLSDPDNIGPAMAVALITTFYGAIMANLLFLPIVEKLRARTDEEIFIMNVIKEGILALRMNSNARVIETKLNAYIPAKRRVKVKLQKKG
jgi:chemotaxis protein MotA